MTDEIAWGATVESPSQPIDDVREWTVEVESEPLGDLADDTTLHRFTHDVGRLAQDASPECSIRHDRFGMVVTVEALSPDEAVQEGERLFKTALETALWPRSVVSPSARYDISVMPAADLASAA